MNKEELYENILNQMKEQRNENYHIEFIFGGTKMRKINDKIAEFEKQRYKLIMDPENHLDNYETIMKLTDLIEVLITMEGK